MVLVVTSYLWFRRKPKESKEIDSPKSGDDRIDQVFFLRHRGFDWVSTDCRAHDRVGPNEVRRWSAIAHLIFFQIFGHHAADSPFHTYQTLRRKSELIFRYIEEDRR